MKKITIITVCFILATSCLFADGFSTSTASGSGSSTTSVDITSKTVKSIKNPFAGAFGFLTQVILGIVGGGLMSLKFATELLTAISHDMDDPNAVKKVILKLILHCIVIVVGTGGILLLVTGA